MAFKAPEHLMVKHPLLGMGSGNNGFFIVPYKSVKIYVMSSDGGEWEHVSVSIKNRCPNWEEMCYIKSLFWDDEDCVVQYHPPQSEYVNNHETCLHLWRPQSVPLPLPPSWMVGVKC